MNIIFLLIQAAKGIETVMLDNDKLMVVLAVVLIIWVGITIFIYATDRKINQLESSVKALRSEKKPPIDSS
jgi:CcmD family protein